jgi:potassium-dependent mechanosensitive channel
MIPYPHPSHPRAPRRAGAAFGWLPILWLLAQCALAQPPAPAPGTSSVPEVTAARLEAARKALEGASLDEGQRQQGDALLNQATASLRAGESLREEKAQLQDNINQAPARIEALRSRLAAPPPLPQEAADLLAAGKLEPVQQRIDQEEPLLLQTQERLRKKEEELTGLLAGPKPLNEAIARLLTLLQQTEAELSRAGGDEPAELAQVRTLAQQALYGQRQAELKLQQLRLANLDRLTSLAQAERDALAAEAARNGAQLAELRQAAAQLRADRAREALQEAEALEARTLTLPPEIAAVAQQNTGLRLELDDVVRKERRIGEDLQAVRQQLAKLKADFERARVRVAAVGLVESVGRLLHRYRVDLPSSRDYLRQAKAREDEIARAIDRQIEIYDQQRESYDTNAVAGRLLASLAAPPVDMDLAALEKEALALLRARTETLGEIQKVYGRYIGELSELAQAQKDLLTEAEALAGYIDQQLLWVPSSGLRQLAEGKGLAEALGWLLDPAHWQGGARDLTTLLQQRPGVALALALLLAAPLLRPLVRRRLDAISLAMRKIRTDSILHTLHATLLTLLLVAPLPALLMLLGYALERLPGAADFSVALGIGLFSAGKMWIGFGLLWQMIRPGHLADLHLHWPEPIREGLHRQLRWFVPLAVPLLFVVASTRPIFVPAPAEALGQLAYLVVCVASALAVFLLLRRKGRVMGYLQQAHPRGWVVQLHVLWFPLVIGLLLALVVIAGLGYFNFAANLGEQTRLTFWLFFSLVVLRDLLLRGLFVTERRLRLEDAVRRREELRVQRAKEEVAAEPDELPIPIEIPELDFEQLSEQTRRLVHLAFLVGILIGTWILWRELIPILGALEQVNLPFISNRTVDGVVQPVPVTLADLLQGLVIIALTFLGAKNLPGLLEITLLQRLPLESGARYAITTLSQYAIAGLGIFAAFASIGIEWSNIQWLVAALGVGVGFGLQEIVANFISGIILLFERPIRVGDVVTVGDVSGVVSRIRIRATTITNWDKQELVVPNKEFITGRVLNWTLTDTVNRVTVTVGAAYGSDLPKALRLLLEAAEENENVLDDPKPFVMFDGFGADALNLVLRAYLGSLDNRGATISALNLAINDKFNAAGINIAFPQRDLHLYTGAPLDVRLHGAPGQEGEILLRTAR